MLTRGGRVGWVGHAAPGAFSSSPRTSSFAGTRRTRPWTSSLKSSPRTSPSATCCSWTPASPPATRPCEPSTCAAAGRRLLRSRPSSRACCSFCGPGGALLRACSQHCVVVLVVVAVACADAAAQGRARRPHPLPQHHGGAAGHPQGLLGLPPGQGALCFGPALPPAPYSQGVCRWRRGAKLRAPAPPPRSSFPPGPKCGSPCPLSHRRRNAAPLRPAPRHGCEALFSCSSTTAP